MALKSVNTGFRITEERQEELKILAAKKRTSVQAIIEEALEQFLAAVELGRDPRTLDSGVATAGDYPYPIANQRWHDALEAVLGDPEERSAIEKSLQWATDSISKKQSAPRKRRIS